MRPRRALAWTALWAGAALAAFAALRAGRGAEVSNQFLTGYLVELSLSVDNVLVFAVIFEHFAVEPARQGRLLLWGVLGSALLRSAFLFAGAAALHRFHWLLDLFGVLLIAMALRMAGVLSVPQVAKAFCKVTCAGLEMERFVPVASTLVMVAIKSRWLVE